MTWVELAVWLLAFWLGSMVILADAISLRNDVTRLERACLVIGWPLVALAFIFLTVLEKFGVEWAARILR